MSFLLIEMEFIKKDFKFHLVPFCSFPQYTLSRLAYWRNN